MDEGTSKVMVIAIILGLGALGYFGIRPLFVAGGMEEVDAVDWSTCSVKRVHDDPYKQTRQIIECDHVLISHMTGPANGGRTVPSTARLRERRKPIRKWFDHQDFAYPHWKLDARQTNTTAFGHPSDYFVLRSMALDDDRGTGDDSLGGHGLAVSAQSRSQVMYTMCVAKTTTWRLCEEVIRSLLLGEQVELTGNTLPPIGLIDSSDVREEVSALADVTSTTPRSTRSAPTTSKSLFDTPEEEDRTRGAYSVSDAEIEKMKKLGSETYIDHCARCHNFGTSSSAPKVGEGVFAKRDREILSVKDSKCTEKDGKPVQHKTTNREFSAAQWKLK